MTASFLQPPAWKSRLSLTTAAALVPPIALVVAFSASVSWLRNPAPLLLLIGWALILTLGLVVSRFRAATAFALTLALSLGFAALIVGRIPPKSPDAFGRPLADTLWLMNVRMWTFLGDLARGIGQVRSGTFPGVAPATFVYGLLLWQTVYWLLWSGFRRRPPWPAVFLCFALLVARDLLSALAPQWSVGMTLAALVFAARGVYAARVDSWDRRGVGYSMLIWEDWSAGLAAIAAVVFVVTGLTTPQWRASIQDFLDSFRAESGEPVAATRRTSGPPTAGSFVPDLGVVGAPFPRGDGTVLYVRTSDPPAGLESDGPMAPLGKTHYWRGAIYDTYTGRGWELAPLGEPALPKTDPPAADRSRESVRQEIEILALWDDRLYAENQPVMVDAGVLLRTVHDDDWTTLLQGTEPSYSVVSWVPRTTGDQLARAGEDYPDSVRSSYLQLPDDVPQRVRDLAVRIAAGAATPFGKAVRVQGFLRSTYTYQDDEPSAPPHRDVVDYFLFDASGGFCSYYATAMAVLLRLEGVPSRVVTGFAGGVWDRGEGRYRVAESQAHAWVEVYFPGYGWIEFEPTPSRPALDYAAGQPSLPARSASPDASDAARASSSALPLVVPAALAALLVAALVWRRGRNPSGAEQALHRIYWQMRRRVAGDGGAHLTPFEFIAQHGRQFEAYPRLDHAARLLTSLYVQGTYSARPATLHDVERARRAWRSTWWDRVRRKRPIGSDDAGSL